MMSGLKLELEIDSHEGGDEVIKTTIERSPSYAPPLVEIETSSGRVVLTTHEVQHIWGQCEKYFAAEKVLGLGGHIT